MSKLPLVDFVLGLQGFEFAAFWVSALVILFGVGFAIDAMLSRQGVGPYVNAILALVGGYAGLYLHDRYFALYFKYEPYLTFGTILLGILFVVLVVNLLRARFYH